MKTAKLSIKNDLGKLLIKLALTKVDLWAKNEINEIRYESKFPVCLEVNAKLWVVGSYRIKQLEIHKYLVETDDKFVHTFYSKQAAIFYSVFTYCQQYKAADKLLVSDQSVAKLCEEFEFYSKKRKKKTADDFKRDLWSIKFIDVKTRYQAARQELEKTLCSAKYNKVWSAILNAN